MKREVIQWAKDAFECLLLFSVEVLREAIRFLNFILKWVLISYIFALVQIFLISMLMGYIATRHGHPATNAEMVNAIDRVLTGIYRAGGE